MSNFSYGSPLGFAITPWVKRLLIANVVVFLLAAVASGVWSAGAVSRYLGFAPALAVVQPWTAVTYMFVHVALFHMLFNCLAIFFFGPPLEDRWGGAAFLRFYLLTGLGGALLALLAAIIALLVLAAPLSAIPIIGASAAVYGIMVAYAMYWPDNPIYFFGIFPIKAKWLVLGLIGISVFMQLTGGQAGVAHLAHLGGAAAAYLYLKSKWAPSQWGNVARPKRAQAQPWYQRLWPFRGSPKASAQRPTRTRSERQPAPAARERSLDRPNRDIDRILDKISDHGIASLTDDELRQLRDASKRS